MMMQTEFDYVFKEQHAGLGYLPTTVYHIGIMFDYMRHVRTNILDKSGLVRVLFITRNETEAAKVHAAVRKLIPANLIVKDIFYLHRSLLSTVHMNIQITTKYASSKGQSLDVLLYYPELDPDLIESALACLLY